MDEQTLQVSLDPVEMDPAQTLPPENAEKPAKRRAKRKSGADEPEQGSKAEPKPESEPAPAVDGQSAPEEQNALEAPFEAGDQPDAALPPDPPSDQPDPQELERLREELTSLREEIRSARQSLIKQEAELEEFRELWPEVSLSALPDSVLEDVRNGVPLSAAYALMERRQQKLAKIAEAANARNQQRSSGSAEGDSSGFLSPAEVRAMSQEQVRKHYRQILLSMPKWH